MQIMVFGDSIVRGVWDITGGGWAQRLAHDLFAEHSKDLHANLPWMYNLGVDGNTSRDLLRRFKPETEARYQPASKVAFIFAIGTNDAWTEADGSGNMSVEEFGANIEQLIERAQQYSPIIMFVGLAPVDEARTRPVSWINISYTNERLKLFDQTLKRVCQERSVHFVPVWDAFQKQGVASLMTDGLHPNDAGHQLIYEHVKPVLQTLVS